MRVHYRFRIVEAIRSVADHGRDPDRVGDIAVPDRTQIVEPFKIASPGQRLDLPAALGDVARPDGGAAPGQAVG
jgi:hypothetical protein